MNTGLLTHTHTHTRKKTIPLSPSGTQIPLPDKAKTCHTHQMSCYCGSTQKFESCCEPFIKGDKLPDTPEELMRSRYSAFVTQNIPYIKNTLAPDERGGFDEKSTREWSKSEWLGLTINSAKGDTVEFTAKYKQNGKEIEHHEVSKFKKIKDKWYFVSGDSHVHENGEGHHHNTNRTPYVREEPKVGRNDPCPCGSGKKYKKCCAA